MSLLEIKKATEANYRITNKTSTNAEIVIYSQIGESLWEAGVTAASFSRDLKDLDKSVKQIDVRLNSPGGDVFDGISIYNRLKQHPANVTVYVDGLAASIASIIALAGDEVVMGEGALMMIHKPMSGVYGNSTEMEEMIGRLDDVEEQLVGIYKRKTQLDRSEIKSMLAAETWLDANEAVDSGFADRLMESEQVLDIAASVNKSCPWMKNVPTEKINNNNYVKKQIGNFKQDVEKFLAR